MRWLDLLSCQLHDRQRNGVTHFVSCSSFKTRFYHVEILNALIINQICITNTKKYAKAPVITAFSVVRHYCLLRTSTKTKLIKERI